LARKNHTRRRVAKIEFGLVVIAGGEHAGRVGIYDTDDTETRALVCFSPLEYVREWHVIPKIHLREATTDALIARNRGIFLKLGFRTHKATDEELVDALGELLLVDNALGHRMIRAQRI
jgi:hypothetical protein